MILSKKKAILYFALITFWIFIVCAIISFILKMRWIIAFGVVVSPLTALVYILIGGEKTMKKAEQDSDEILTLDARMNRQLLEEKRNKQILEERRKVPLPPLPPDNLTFESEDPVKAITEDFDEIEKLKKLKSLKKREDALIEELNDVKRRKADILKDFI